MMKTQKYWGKTVASFLLALFTMPPGIFVVIKAAKGRKKACQMCPPHGFFCIFAPE